MITIRSGFYKWFTYVHMAIMCLLGLLFLLVTIFELVPFEEPENRIYFLVFLFVWNAFVFYSSYSFLVMPTKIMIRPDSSFVLSGPLMMISSLPNEVSKIDCDTDGDWYIWCKNKKIDLRFFKQAQLEPFFKSIKDKNSSVSGV